MVCAVIHQHVVTEYIALKLTYPDIRQLLAVEHSLDTVL